MLTACLRIRSREAAAMAGPAATEGAKVRNGAEIREGMLSDGWYVEELTFHPTPTPTCFRHAE